MRVVSIVTVIGILVVLGLLAHSEKQSFDPKSYYKANCEECHGASAEKRFNPDSPEGQMIDSILNGAKAEGSKDMPAFAEKGIDKAKARRTAIPSIDLSNSRLRADARRRSYFSRVTAVNQ